MDDRQQGQTSRNKSSQVFVAFLLGSLMIATPAAYFLGTYLERTKHLHWITIAKVCATNAIQLEAHVKTMLNNSEVAIMTNKKGKALN